MTFHHRLQIEIEDLDDVARARRFAIAVNPRRSTLKSSVPLLATELQALGIPQQTLGDSSNT